MEQNDEMVHVIKKWVFDLPIHADKDIDLSMRFTYSNSNQIVSLSVPVGRSGIQYKVEVKYK